MKLNLSKPAVIAAISYLVLAFMILLPFNYNTITIDDENNNSPVIQQQPFMYRLMMLIVLLVPILISIYSINCMVVGKCLLWSYINAIAIALWVIMLITVSFITT